MEEIALQYITTGSTFLEVKLTQSYIIVIVETNIVIRRTIKA